MSDAGWQFMANGDGLRWGQGNQAGSLIANSRHDVHQLRRTVIAPRMGVEFRAFVMGRLVSGLPRQWN